MDIKLYQLTRLLDKIIKCNITCRLEEEGNCKTSKLKDYYFDKNYRTIVLNYNDKEIKVNDIFNISCSIYKEFTSLCIHGNTVPKIEVDLPFYEVQDILVIQGGSRL